MTVEESENRLKAAGRNDPCPCGSGKKYKKCHRAEDEAAVHAKLAQQKAAAEAEARAAEAAEGKPERDAGSKPKQAGAPSSRTQQPGTGRPRDPGARAAQLPRRGAV